MKRYLFPFLVLTQAATVLTLRADPAEDAAANEPRKLIPRPIPGLVAPASVTPVPPPARRQQTAPAPAAAAAAAPAATSAASRILFIHRRGSLPVSESAPKDVSPPSASFHQNLYDRMITSTHAVLPAFADSEGMLSMVRLLVKRFTSTNAAAAAGLPEASVPPKVAAAPEPEKPSVISAGPARILFIHRASSHRHGPGEAKPETSAENDPAATDIGTTIAPLKEGKIRIISRRVSPESP